MTSYVLTVSCQSTRGIVAAISGWRQGLVAGVLSFAGAAHAEDVVRIGTLSDYAPFEYRDAKGELKGMEIELAKTMCKHIQAKCE